MRVSADQDHSFTEVNSIKNFALKNRTKLNLKRSWEMVVRGRISKPLPPLAKGIERKCWLKLFGIISEENPSDWDLHADNLLRNLLVAVYTSYASVNILDTLKINRQNYLIG